MNQKKRHWGIIGGGVLGMQLANRLIQQGHRVTLHEAGRSMGGLTMPWKIEDTFWDKFYHVILLSDTTLLALLKEIGLEDQLSWVETKTGFYTENQLYSMSNTLEFLRFPPLSLLDKLRLGFTIFYAARVKNWKRLERIPVAEWLLKLSGKNTFEKIWLPLLLAKLGENYKHTSAAFIWATIQRMYAARRTGLKKEMFGYVKGGYNVILEKLVQHLIQQGVSIQTNCPVARVQPQENGSIKVESFTGESFEYDEVILTVPAHIAAGMCEALSQEEEIKLRDIEYLGVICVSVLLKKRVSPFYVTNITDPSPFTGIIEMTNIVDPNYFGGNHLVYLPKYVKRTDPVFQWKDEEIKTHFRSHFIKMYDHIKEEDLLSIQMAKAPNVFALSTLNYSENLPPVSTSIPGIHILNSAHIVNGTLNVNESLQLVDKALPGILEKANAPKIITNTYE